MRRRDFIALAGGVAVIGLRNAEAQPKKVWRVGQVLAGTRETHGFLALALEERLSELGDKENVVVTDRFARPEPSAVQEEIAALSSHSDVLVVYSTIGGVAAKRVAPPIPVVFVSVGAPVEIGLVQTLSHPGGNMTGVTFEAASETYQRRLQLLKELVPSLMRVAVLRAHGDANAAFATNALEKGAPQLCPSTSIRPAISTVSLPKLLHRRHRDWSSSQALLPSLCENASLNLRLPIGYPPAAASRRLSKREN